MAEQGTPEFWAEGRPDAIAVIHGDDTLTYGDWNRRADHVADGLARLGLTAGDRLGMRFRLGIEWFVLQRALQKLLVEQVAVNWKLTPDEAVYILRDSEAKGLACDDRDPSKWAAHDPGILVTVGQKASSSGIRYEDLVDTPDPLQRFGPLRPMLVLYTSGTTGAPRGVPPLDAARVTDFDRLFRYGASVGSNPAYPDDPVVLLTLPVHHGAGPGIATGACAKGGTVVLLDPYDPEAALALIAKHRVQVWTAVPTMLLRVRALPDEVIERYDLSSLSVLTAGAAPVPQVLKEWLIDLFGPILWEGYGASEAGMVTYVEPKFQLKKPGTSGLPYDGVEVVIVGADWERLPAGETGEIAVNTPVVLKHYVGAADLGEETIKDGFFRTGDVGHLDEDGFLFITDRAKDMIVAGGVNIYPAEVEKVLVQHPDIVDVAVVGIPEADFGEQPLAFVVTASGGKLDEDELRTFLDGRLATYKHPRQFEFVDSLPLSPMGKVLKTELRAPYWIGRERRV